MTPASRVIHESPFCFLSSLLFHRLSSKVPVLVADQVRSRREGKVFTGVCDSVWGVWTENICCTTNLSRILFASSDYQVRLPLLKVIKMSIRKCSISG